MDNRFHIRSAGHGDSRLLYEWRDDEETRQMSSTSELLSWEDHVEWFEKTLSGGFPGRSLYIVETASHEPVGTVRCDERSDGFTEVSYTVSPLWRGKGAGKRMVMQFAREHLAGKKLAARIKKGMNPASEAIARALGLSPSSETPSEHVSEPPMVEWR